jgi:hypothetical protein
MVAGCCGGDTAAGDTTAGDTTAGDTTAVDTMAGDIMATENNYIFLASLVLVLLRFFYKHVRRFTELRFIFMRTKKAAYSKY